MEPITHEDVQGWVTDAEVFKSLIREVRPKTIIEVGSWKGKSAILMAQTCRELGLDTKIYCVDTWLGAREFIGSKDAERDLMLKDGYPQVYYEFMKNIRRAGVDDMITPIPNTSRIASQVLPSVDLIYIDASHDYEDVRDDILAYTKKLNDGGVMFGDDYTNSVFPGVKKAVDEAFKADILSNWYWVYRKA